MTDHLKRTVGSIVHTKATFVVHESSASQRFGSKWKTRLVPGVVLSVHKRPGKGKTNRKSTWVKARFYLGPGITQDESLAEVEKNTYVKEVLLGNLKVGLPEAAGDDCCTVIPDAFLKNQTDTFLGIPEKSNNQSVPTSPSPSKPAAPVETAPSSSLREHKSFADAVRSPQPTPVSQKTAKQQQNVSFMASPSPHNKEDKNNQLALEDLQKVLSAKKESGGGNNAINAAVSHLLSLLKIAEDDKQNDEAKSNASQTPLKKTSNAKTTTNNATKVDEYDSDFEEPPTPYRSTRKYQEETKKAFEDEDTTSARKLFEKKSDNNNHPTGQNNGDREMTRSGSGKGNDDATVTTNTSQKTIETHGVKWYRDVDGLSRNGIGKAMAPHQSVETEVTV